MIPLLDLAAQYESIKPEIDEAISEVLTSSQFILGPAVERFERQFAEYCGVRFAIGVNSGTSALHLALLGLEIGPGDEVITVAHTFVATVAAINYCGAKPVLVDVDPHRYTMDSRQLEDAITPRTRAIIPVHIYGQMAEMAPIARIAGEAGVPLIEDAAQAHGASYGNRKAGSIGEVGCFSFYPGKNLGAYGEAGCAVTDNEQLASRMRAIRDWGQIERGVHALPGYNYRMEGIQGAVLGVKLRHLDKWNDARRRAAGIYDDLISRSRRADMIDRPTAYPDGRHVFHQYVIRVRERDRLRRELLAHGIQTGVHYPRPVHLHPAHSNLGYGEGCFPNSERITRDCVSMPIYPELGDASIQRVVAAIEASLA